MSNTLAQAYLKELQTESTATRKCLERVPETLYDFKPHETSMAMGYLTLLVADIPRWITYSIRDGVIDFANFPQIKPKTTDALLKHYDKSLADAIEILSGIDDHALLDTFTLKHSDKILISVSKGENLSSTINHWVHHRGQLTVYMRMNGIAVPSIYGPSADEKTF